MRRADFVAAAIGRRLAKGTIASLKRENSMNRAFLLICGAWCCAAVAVGCASPLCAADSNFTLRSPDERIEVRIRLASRISYDVLLNNKPLVEDSSLAMNMGGRTLGENPVLQSSKKGSVDKMLEPAVRQKFARVREHYNELRLDFDGYTVVFRAYPEGFAYRFETALGGEN